MPDPKPSDPIISDLESSHSTLSAARLAANRANAAKSTGPRTPEGKQRASLNALRHGLTAQIVILPGEDMQAYLDFTAKFVRDLDAHSEVEKQLAHDLADTQWRLNRLRSIECGIFAMGHHHVSDNIGAEHPEVHTALTTAQVFLDNAKPLENLSRQENRLRRNFQSTLQQLLALQDRRREREDSQMVEAARIYRTQMMKKTPFNPAELGFVLPLAEIERYVNRQELAAESLVASLNGYNLERFTKAIAA